MPIVAGLPGQDTGEKTDSAAGSGWFYAGQAMFGDASGAIGASRVIAFVENSTSHEGLMLSVGDTFDGGVVKEIGPGSIMVARGSSVERISRTDAFNATPLNEPPRQQTTAQTRTRRGGAAFAGPAQGQAGTQGGGPPAPGDVGGFLRNFMRSPGGRQQMQLLMQQIGPQLDTMLGGSGAGQ
jgi:hypothetical protein